MAERLQEMERSVIIGVKVFTVVFLLMLTFPIMGGAWFVYDAADILINTSSSEGEITRCNQQSNLSFSGGKGERKFSKSIGYHIVATTADDLEIVGTFGHNKRADCEESIGDVVPMYLDEREPRNSRIATITQFWLPPLVGGITCIVFCYGFFILGRNLFRKIPNYGLKKS